MEQFPRRTYFPLLIVIALVVAGLLLLSWNLAPATQAGPDFLPIRDTPTRAREDDGKPKPVSAVLELRVQPANPGLWGVVQWQDTAGNWHDVEGWQGAVPSGVQVWGVFPSEFGKGPFRWALYEGAGGKFLKASASFNLPSRQDAVVRVDVGL